MKLEKITRKSDDRTWRHYEDACAAAHALDLVGERWSLLVMRELMLGPKRFTDLRDSLPGISANVLTQRLEGLEAAGILMRRKLPPPSGVQVYELTDWGYESEPIFQALCRWAMRSPAHNPALPFSTNSLLISLRTLIDPVRARDIRMGIGFRLGEESFLVQLADGRLDVTRGPVEGADVIFTGSAQVLLGAIYGRKPLDDLENAGVLRVEGNRALAEQFANLFPLPPKATRPA